MARVSFTEALLGVKEALGKEGFGVLTEIDVQETLKKKLKVNFQSYVILGACNPTLVHQALVIEPAIGLLLPCNVVVTEAPNGDVVVSVIDPQIMFSILKQPALEAIAGEARTRLRRVLESL
ncbi:MAG: DUF302 domain-containing protein [Pseudomonadota bacterium]